MDEFIEVSTIFKVNKLWTAILVMAAMLCSAVSVYAADLNNEETNPLQEAIADLENGYSEYYDILNIELTLCSSEEVNGNIENIYLLNMTAVLKANSVEQMDYYKGVQTYFDMASEAACSSDSKNQERMRVLETEKADIYAELEAYIGQEQELIFFIKEAYSVNDEAKKTILFENGIDYVSWEEMLPDSHEELFENGYSQMEYFDLEYAIATEEGVFFIFNDDDDFHYGVEEYDYVFYVNGFYLSADGQSDLIYIQPIELAWKWETNRWLEWGNDPDEGPYYDVREGGGEILSFPINGETEFHFYNDDAYDLNPYLYEICDRYSNRECVTNDPKIFLYYIQTQFTDNAADYPFFMILDENGCVKYIIEYPFV